ncbi:Zinc finger (Ran-binding) family protein, putative isoform 2 [Theobroma cacao]|uniref:Zinc finger (Ran-binding) family protein, putative isoform 2 n=1 Tax=Theobroma cacao TaxID=3641 RepID=A0A061FWS2_THECC|nr:Zinc finger (Ran-binding) family protein, putative isoform 2 [Theobroma cacao]
MSALRSLLFGTSVFRAQKPLFLPFPSQLLSSKPFPTLALRFHRHTSSAAALDTTLNANSTELLDSASEPHPWPEWVTFVDRLKSKGYLVEATAATADAGTDYKDMNLLKDACLSFARDRYDLFKLLSTNEIETVVGSGCPNLFRKAVNSAKRLRAYVRLDEGDVCSTCNLRGSCDRAYVILKESEGASRTVDIVRILLSYALDPIVISGGEKPPGREHIDVSARNLLSDLTKLSETSPAPELPRPAAKASPRKEKTISGNDDEVFQNVEMKRGDWMCPKCNFMNFSRNIRCLKCKAEGPKKVVTDDIQMKKGDWNCPECGFMNFASNRKCLRCQEARPKRQLNPGEWECPSCDFLNYRRNKVCLKCNHDRPKEQTKEYNEHTWRRPLQYN